MIEAAAYYVKNGGAVLVRCYGEGAYVEVPSMIDGLPVTELADHCFAPEKSSAVYRRERVQISTAAGKRLAEEPADALCGDQLQEIILPDTLTAIGDYAFYNCYHLEKLFIPAGVERLGSGIFVAANHLKSLRFGCAADRLVPPCMKDILGEITYELDVTVEDERGIPKLCLIFPEYYEEAIENTPARLINFAFAGTGFRYRQCFTAEGEIDLPRYDAALETASVQEYPPTVLKLSLYRLLTPADLTENAKQAYLQYLRKEKKAAAAWILENDRMDMLQALIRIGYFEGDEGNGLLDLWLDQAAGRQRPEAVNRLMELRRKQRSRTTAGKKYVL